MVSEVECGTVFGFSIGLVEFRRVNWLFPFDNRRRGSQLLFDVYRRIQFEACNDKNNRYSLNERCLFICLEFHNTSTIGINQHAIVLKFKSPVRVVEYFLL